ncbi:MAG: peptidylprolyl isomerase [Candidatus Riflebacteria bacterium]
MFEFLVIVMVILAPMCVAQVPDGVKMENPANPLIKITTDKGDMLLELFPDVAPKHVESMLNLIKKGYYNNLSFHRVVSGFVIQGGCPKGDGTGGPGYTLPAEFNKRKHLKGTLAMARTSDPNSAGSQFYICLDVIPHLDNQYTVFGQMVQGHETPEKIKQGDKMNIVILNDLAAPAK